MTRVLVSPAAQRDIERIAAHIAADNPDAASRWLEVVERTFDLLENAPDIGRLRDDLHPRYRGLPVGNYVIFYWHKPNVVQVDRVLHGARDIPRILEDDV